MPRKPSRREQQARMDGLVLEVEALAKKFGCPFSDIAYYLLYQTEVATGCEVHADNPDDEETAQKMADVIEDSNLAAHDDSYDFVNDYHDRIAEVGRRWDPEFRRKLVKRSDYAKLTEPYDPKKHGSFAEWAGPEGQKKITEVLRKKINGKT